MESEKCIAPRISLGWPSDEPNPNITEPFAYMRPSDADYEVKSWPAFFSQMVEGIKKHDMRDKTERTYKVGDKVLLREYDPFGGGYTGRSAIFAITYITSNDTPCAMSSNALDNDACILSVERVSPVFEAA